MLSPEEQGRADAFHGDSHRRDYVVAHVALRSVLGECLGLSAAEVRFAEGSFDGNGMHGQGDGRIKPALPGGGLDGAAGGLSAPDIRFNLSHTRGMALIGVAMGRELGVDVEFQRPMEDLDAMARSVMSHEELGLWQEILKTDRERAFYRVWTRKEAYLKAIGLGLYRSLQEITVPVTAEALDPNAKGLVQDRAGEGRWWIRDVAVQGVYAAAVCSEGDDATECIVQDLDLTAIR
jgi:4'-phosphopantetheinyl transferase